LLRKEIQLASQLRYAGVAIEFSSKEIEMLNWALTFFLIALLAAVFGFTGIALAAAGIAKIIFFLFLVLFLVSLVAHVARKV
jgi:uncharacterized membrane protein YtjA (UPF0391 family)